MPAGSVFRSVFQRTGGSASERTGTARLAPIIDGAYRSEMRRACRIEAVIASGNSPRKHVWRAGIVLLSADGGGTMEIQRQTGKGKSTIWRWQERFITAGATVRTWSLAWSR